jgi:small subunit ribosomal protein S18
MEDTRRPTKGGNKGKSNKGGGSGRGQSDRKFVRKDGAEGGFRRGSGARPQRFSIPKGTDISYKNLAFLQKCLTERGKIFSRRLTSASAKEQRLLSVAVKRARFLGLLPVGSSRRK